MRVEVTGAKVRRLRFFAPLKNAGRTKRASLRMAARKIGRITAVAVTAVEVAVAVVAARWVGRTGYFLANRFRPGRLAGRFPVAGPED